MTTIVTACALISFFGFFILRLQTHIGDLEIKNRWLKQELNLERDTVKILRNKGGNK